MKPGRSLIQATTLAPALLLAVLAVASCEPSEPDTGTELAHPLSVNEFIGERLGDAPIYPYEFLAAEDREDWIELAPDLIIEERPGDPRYAFGSMPPNLAVDDAGNIFVFDPSNHRIVVFDAEGEVVLSFGARGEGPGEFAVATRGAMGFRDGLLFMFKSGSVRFWTPEGRFVEHLFHRIDDYQEVVAVDDGTFVTTDMRRVAGYAGGPHWLLARYAVDGDNLERGLRYAVAPPWSQPDFAADPSGDAYMGIIGEGGRTSYLVAYDTEANIRWVAPCAWPPGELLPAEVVLDGRGRIFFMPRVNKLTEVAERTVDVFTSNGQIIGRARIENFQTHVKWQQTSGDFVYGVEADPDTFEWRVIRYRLQLPFD